MKNTNVKLCKFCKKELSSTGKDKKFCNRHCYVSHQKSGNYKIEKAKTGSLVKCKNCNESFYQAKCKINSQNNHFCSRECYLQDHKKAYKTVECKKCNKKKEVSLNQFLRYKKEDRDFYCGDKCRSNRDRTLLCIVCKTEYCAISYRKANNVKGFTIIRGQTKTCSEKCLRENIRTNQERKDKISKAFSGSNHPNYVNGASYNERVRKTDIKENFGISDKKEVFKKFKNKCFKCGAKDNLTVDHHIPFSRGGLLVFSNCVLLCKSCNSRKNAKMPKDFYNNKEISKLEQLGIFENNLFNFNDRKT